MKHEKSFCTKNLAPLAQLSLSAKIDYALTIFQMYFIFLKLQKKLTLVPFKCYIEVSVYVILTTWTLTIPELTNDSS